MRQRRLIAAVAAALVCDGAAATALAQQAAEKPDAEKLAKQVEAQQADLAEQEGRIRDLEKKLAAVLAKQKEAEKALAAAPPPAPPPPPPPPPAPAPSLESLLPEFLRDMRIVGYVQGQYESHQDSDDQLRPGGDLANQNRFVLRRARLKIEKEWKWASGMIEIDGNSVRGPSIGLQHAEASVLYRGNRPFTQPPILKLTFGLFDVPFGYELVESPKTRWFMERSLISRSLFPAEPDLGARLSAALGWFRATVAVTNGEPLGERTGYPLRDPNAAKDIIARVGVDVNPISWMNIAGGVSVLNGKGFHAGTDASKNIVQWNDLNEDGVIEQNELTAVLATSALPSQSFTRWAVGGDLRLGFTTPIGLTQLNAEVIVANNLDRGLFIADPILTGIDNREIGAMVGVTQEIFGYGVVGFRFDTYNPNNDSQDRQGGTLTPTSQTVRTFSPIVGLAIPDRARLLFQYDVIRDSMGRDPRGVPTDLRNDTWTLRLQGSL